MYIYTWVLELVVVLMSLRKYALKPTDDVTE